MISIAFRRSRALRPTCPIASAAAIRAPGRQRFVWTFIVLFAALWLAFASRLGWAALTIEIIGGGERQIPVAIAPLAGEAGLEQRISEIVAADLARSGLFRMIDPGGITPMPVEPGEVRYGDWSARGAEALVIGAVTPAANGRFELRFRLMDVLKQSQLAGFSYSISNAQVRNTAHRIADIIYEKLLGVPGAFATRITYVVKQGTRFELQVADADGHGAQTVVASNEPIISPAWSPEGNRIAYVSFEQRKPIVYVQTLSSGQRRVLANFRGSNSSPAWSPDGRRLAVVLTRDGNSQIYSIDAEGGGISRLSNSASIDTEPNFSPDGQSILFTSDRGGSPQIYRMPASGGAVERLTFDGTYNVSPRYSPDGKSFVYVQRNGGRFSLILQELGTRQVIPLTEGAMDESPSFAPNGRMVMYASIQRGRGILAAVSNDGRIKQRLTVQAGDVREPAWGPMQKGF
ncbi:MAG: Tol-Pal system protein TolB [Burkholderiales bacterium]|nr:Tol-Pal system protein TolB [Burkholderiales bacterium]